MTMNFIDFFDYQYNTLVYISCTERNDFYSIFMSLYIKCIAEEGAWHKWRERERKSKGIMAREYLTFLPCIESYTWTMAA